MADRLPIREIFANALECPSEAERVAYLDRACAGAPDVLKRVEELLHAHMVKAVGFMEKPGPDLLATDANRTAHHQPGDDTPGRGPSQSTPADPNRTIDLEPVKSETPEKDRVGETIGGYQLVRKLGDGGMGTVYLGEKRDGNEALRVAIKLIKPDRVNPHLVARFKAERRILTRLNHGNVAKVFDMGVHAAEPASPGAIAAQEPYFIMEYVADKDSPGHTLDGFCAAHKLSIRDRLALFEAVCRGVDHAHSSGVIHRDLKGLNVLVAVPKNGQPVAKVIDFGLAKALEDEQDIDSELTSPGSFMGTPAYVSPEQASGDAGIGPRTDVYALGVILYKLLTGTLPIDLAGVRNHFEMVKRVREVIPPLPSAMVKKREDSLVKVADERQIEPGKLPSLLRGDLDWVVMKALEKDAAKRYPTAGALADEVRRFLDGEPVEAGPDGRWYQLRKFVRRNRSLVTAGSVVFLTLAIAVVGLYAGLREVKAANDKEIAAREEETVARRNETAAKIQAEEAEVLQRKALVISWGGLRAQIRSGEIIDEERKSILKDMLAELRQLVRETPDASRRVHEIGAETTFRLATISAMLDMKEADSLYEETIRRYEALLADFPADMKVPSALARARCRFDHAFLYQKTGRIADAISEFRLAIKLYEDVVTSSPDEPTYRLEMANAWNDLGVALKRDGKLTEAEQVLRTTIDERKKVVPQENGRSVYSIGLAMGYHNLGNVTRDQGKLRESIDVYGKAIELLQPLALGTGGTSKDASRVLIDTCWDRANAWGQFGHHAEAFADWNAAWQINEINKRNETNKFYDSNLLARFRAASELELKLKGRAITAAEAYLAAKINAQAYKAATGERTLQDHYSMRALGLLTQAKAGGYFGEEKNVAALKSDADFAALPKEEREAFLAGLPAPSMPKK